MSRSPSRHTRLTSLVGALLTAAVAACLVAFSLVAQHAAQQSPEAPAVRPLLPGENGGDPIEIAPFAEADEGEGGPENPETSDPAPTPSAEDDIDDLLALADEPPSTPPVEPEPQGPDDGFPRRGPTRSEPRVSGDGADDPARCGETRCRPDARPPGTSEPAGGPGEDDCDDAHARHGAKGKGHAKGHCKALGRGHNSARHVNDVDDHDDPAEEKGAPDPSAPQPAASPSDDGEDGKGHGASSAKPQTQGPPPHAEAHGDSTPPGQAKPKPAPPGRAKAKGHGKKH